MVDTERTQFKMMLPVEIKTRLEEAAHQNRRSLSAEIISRLEFSITNPPDAVELLKMKFESLVSEIDKMEEDLRSQAETIALQRELNSKLETAFHRTTDVQRRVLYHVLSYIDDIPKELAIWVFDIAEGLNREVVAQEQLNATSITEEEAIARIKEKRDHFQDEAYKLVKAFLDEMRGDDNSR